VDMDVQTARLPYFADCRSVSGPIFGVI
jgi:hypothetical protein